MATIAFKNEKIDAIKENIAKAKVTIVTDFTGLSVSQITELRRRLQNEGGDLQVIKNTLAKIAVQGTEFEKLAEILKGPIAIAYGFQDQVAPAKIVAKFIKDTKKLVIVGGVLDGKLLSAKEVEELAKLPSKEELLSKMLGSLNAPATGIITVITGVMKSMVIAMEEVRKQKESA